MSRVSVRAAGVLPYRVRKGQLEVAMVHRPRYDDWSWPKGKLDRGEDWATAAARETVEETGLTVRLGMPLPEAQYRLRGGQLKRVRYWAGEVIGGSGELEHEVDEVIWLSPDKAGSRLSYERDCEQLGALVTLERAGLLDTWPLLVVRHATALPRGNWKKPDPLRPLDDAGHRWSAHLVPLLTAYAPTRLLSSPSVRCYDTVKPFATVSGVELVTKKGLSEEGFEADPSKLDKHLGRLLDAGEPAALCTHGPVLEPLLATVRSLAGKELDSGSRSLLTRLRKKSLDKGEVLALTMTGTGADARVVALERHRPPS
ncbi:NUDIX hydrolase [Ornithinimicrobium sp. Y1847]|uniref:NUDIX hydrolase n=1 Tax=Ornithinimicrobium sp. Y1847 TaxID=3405419 RepID=UPI003B67755D